MTGLDAVEIETEFYFLRHQFSTTNWTKAAQHREEREREKKEVWDEEKAYASFVFMSLLKACIYSGILREIMCSIANQSLVISNVYWTSFIYWRKLFLKSS